jgi:GAF domain-containing protein/anti-sigma regulatory factor (Ser/Thr protein kinase)
MIGEGDAGRRLDLLMAAGELVDRGAALDDVMQRVLDLVVPAAADFCFVFDGNGQRLSGVRSAFAGADELEAELAAAGRDWPRPDEPVLIDALEHAREELAPLARAGLRSAVIAPLRARGRITGSITLGVGPSGRRYGREDLRFVGVLAGRLGLTLDNARLAVTERQLAALIGSMEDAVSVRDAAGELVLANQASLELLGVQSLSELRALSLEQLRERFALYTADGRPLGDEDLGFVRALETGSTPEPLLFRRVTRASGRQQWLRSKTTIVGGPGGPPLVMTITEDVTAARRAEIGQRLLVDAGRVLSQSLAGDEVLQQIADLVVPTLADWCGIDLPGPGGELRMVATAHADPAKLVLARQLRARRPLRTDADEIVPTVLRTGASVRLEIPPELLEAAALDAEHLAMLQAAGLSSLLSVPLVSGTDTLGVLTLIASQPDRRFDDADQDLAEALGRRVGDALRNARLLHDRSQIATVLSAGLRPDEAPELPGCAVAALYRPAGEGTEAGGDFYDVIDAPNGPIVVMGDVVGKGASAAALSAVARVTLHTAGRLTAEPRAALDELNNALRRRGGMSLTTVVAVAMPTELPGTAQLLLAGHPPPLLWRDGEVRQVGRHGPMLGAVEVADWPSVPVALAPGDLLVLYTDGVLDAVLPGGERFGEDRLARLVAASGGTAEALVAGLERELARMWLRDDVALMAIHCSAQPALLARATLGPDDDVEPLLALTIAGGPAAPGEARRALTQALAGRVPGVAQGDALIVVSELVTNAVRHGGARVASDAVSVHAALTPAGVRIEVTDPGAGFEPGGHGPRADGGYGLHLLDRLATRWGVAGAEPVTVWVELAR